MAALNKPSIVVTIVNNKKKLIKNTNTKLIIFILLPSITGHLRYVAIQGTKK